MKQTLIAIAALATVASASAAQTEFDNFTPLSSSQTTALPESAPVLLSSPLFTQEVIANRTNQNALVPGSNSGNWDMITANETGADAGRYLFMPFETGSAGVQRVDLWDNNYNTRTVTIVAPGTSSFVSGDASRWTPWGSYLTAEESWGATSTKGRVFEITNATTAAANGGDFVQRSIIPRVSHEGLAFDSANSFYFIDEFNGGSLYKYVSNNANATNGNDYFASGQTFVAKVGGGNSQQQTQGKSETAAEQQATERAAETERHAANQRAVEHAIDGRHHLRDRVDLSVQGAAQIGELLGVRSVHRHDRLHSPCRGAVGRRPGAATRHRSGR